MTRRRALLAPALLALVVGLTGCASDEPAPAAATTAEAPPSPTAEEAESTTLTAETFMRTIVDAQTAAGSYDFTMSMKHALMGDLMSASGAVHTVEGRTESIALVMDMADTPQITIRKVGASNFVQFGEMTGGKFIEVDGADPAHPFGAEFTESLDDFDPTMDVAQFEAAVVSVTAVGDPTDLDGVEVQEYEVVIDPSKMPEQLAEIEEELPAGQELPETLSYTYLVTAEGLALKVSYDIIGISTELTMMNWGNATPITAPTPEEMTSEDPFQA